MCGLYCFHCFCEGLLALDDHQISIAGSRSNLSIGVLSEFSRSKSSNASMESSERLLTLIIPSKEKTLSSFPFDAGKENRSLTSDNVLVHSEEHGA